MLQAKAFKDMTKEEQVAFLEKRKEYSREKYEATKIENEKKRKAFKEFKQKVHNGNRIIDELEKQAEDNKSNIKPYVWSFRPTPAANGDWIASAVLVPMKVNKKSIICECTYSLKSPNDIYKPHVGRGLCGTRLNGDNPWKFEINIPKEKYVSKRDTIQQAISSIISAKIIIGASHLPKNLYKILY